MLPASTFRQADAKEYFRVREPLVLLPTGEVMNNGDAIPRESRSWPIGYISAHRRRRLWYTLVSSTAEGCSGRSWLTR
jgi:hypothetical protein